MTGVEVVQWQLIELVFHVLAQPVHHAHDQLIQQVALAPDEDVGHEVHDQHEGDDDPELVEVDAGPGDQVHPLEHIGEIGFALRPQSGDGLRLGGARGHL